MTETLLPHICAARGTTPNPLPSLPAGLPALASSSTVLTPGTRCAGGAGDSGARSRAGVCSPSSITSCPSQLTRDRKELANPPSPPALKRSSSLNPSGASAAPSRGAGAGRREGGGRGRSSPRRFPPHGQTFAPLRGAAAGPTPTPTPPRAGDATGRLPAPPAGPRLAPARPERGLQRGHGRRNPLAAACGPGRGKQRSPEKQRAEPRPRPHRLRPGPARRDPHPERAPAPAAPGPATAGGCGHGDPGRGWGPSPVPVAPAAAPQPRARPRTCPRRLIRGGAEAAPGAASALRPPPAPRNLALSRAAPLRSRHYFLLKAPPPAGGGRARRRRCGNNC